MAEMGLLVDHQTLDLMEHRRVGLVGIATIDPPRRDDAQGRLRFQHGANLYRARMRAQERARAVGGGREIERVVVLARRMFGRHVERGEIVEVGLDVGALGDREAHGGEDLGDLVGDLTDGMDATLGERTFAHRERDVGALLGQLLGGCGARKFSPPCLERLTDRRLQAVDDLAVGFALIRRQRAERLHQLGDAALLAERGDADLFKLVEVGRFRDGVKQLGLETVELKRAHGSGS